jgi:hypothetical protein
VVLAWIIHEENREAAKVAKNKTLLSEWVAGFAQEFSDFNAQADLYNFLLSEVLSAYFPAPLPFVFMDTGRSARLASWRFWVYELIFAGQRRKPA